jgi:hypothetical protein
VEGSIMNLLVPQPTYTADDLLTLPEGDRFELVDGRLVEKDMGARSSHVGGELAYLLKVFNHTSPVGWVLPADASYPVPPRPP